MYFPDNFAGLTALSKRVARFVSRFRTAIGRPVRSSAERSLRPHRNGGVSALSARGECADTAGDGMPET